MIVSIFTEARAARVVMCNDTADVVNFSFAGQNGAAMLAQLQPHASSQSAKIPAGAFTFWITTASGGSASADLTVTDRDIVVMTAPSGVTLIPDMLPAPPAGLSALWDWWFRGFTLGIGFCTLGAFVRLIRAAKGSTSLEL
jgi:hypothetical protein